MDSNQGILQVLHCVVELHGVFGSVGAGPGLLVGLLLLLELGFRHVCCLLLAVLSDLVLDLLQTVHVLGFSLLHGLVEHSKFVTFGHELKSLEGALGLSLLELKLA